MMDTLTTITYLIQSPPGQLAAGGVLAGIVWKFFKAVGDVLNEQTNREIARWIRVKHVETGLLAEEAVNWPNTFVKVFDRVFGPNHLSWKCFWRSVAASSIMTVLGVSLFLSVTLQKSGHPTTDGGAPLDWSFRWWTSELLILLPIAITTNAAPDYLSLLKTRYLLGAVHGKPSRGMISVIIDIGLTSVLSLSSALLLGLWYPVTDSFVMTIWRAAWHLLSPGAHPQGGMEIMEVTYPALQITHIFSSIRILITQDLGIIFVYPAFFTSIWLWLYAGSGFLLKAARRFDIGFGWFNRRFDIEKKPLQSIGLVAGVLVAVVYWAAAIVSRLLA